jgi:MFS family permease
VLFRAYNSDASPFHTAGTDLLGLIGGFGVGFSFLMGPVANLLLRKYGVRGPVALGVACMTIGLELGSLSNAWWQLMLSQGMLFGIGASLVFIPAISLPSQYFSKKRGLATGIGSVSSADGAYNIFSSDSSICYALSLEPASAPSSSRPSLKQSSMQQAGPHGHYGQ